MHHDSHTGREDASPHARSASHACGASRQYQSREYLLPGEFGPKPCGGSWGGRARQQTDISCRRWWGESVRHARPAFDLRGVGGPSPHLGHARRSRPFHPGLDCTQLHLALVLLSPITSAGHAIFVMSILCCSSNASRGGFVHSQPMSHPSTHRRPLRGHQAPELSRFKHDTESCFSGKSWATKLLLSNPPFACSPAFLPHCCDGFCGLTQPRYHDGSKNLVLHPNNPPSPKCQSSATRNGGISPSIPSWRTKEAVIAVRRERDARGRDSSRSATTI